MKIFKKHLINTFLLAPRLSTIVLILCLGVAIMLSGCAQTIVKEKVVTAVDTVEVTKIIPCKIDGLTCSFKGEGYLPTYYLIDCLRAHKRLLNICAGKNKDIPSNASTETIKAYIEKEIPSLKMNIK